MIGFFGFSGFGELANSFLYTPIFPRLSLSVGALMIPGMIAIFSLDTILGILVSVGVLIWTGFKQTLKANQSISTLTNMRLLYLLSAQE